VVASDLVKDGGFFGQQGFTQGTDGAIEFYPVVDRSYHPSTHGASRDRIMFVSCLGTCGKSLPAPEVMVGDQLVDHRLAPYNWAYDAASTPTFIGGSSVGNTVSSSYGAPKPGYCFDNLNLHDPALPGRVDVSAHQCYAKCLSSSPCEGQDCFCGGAIDGWDTPSSNALCLDETSCKDLCSGLPDCTGYDMHRSKTRCFLNRGTCVVVADDEYQHVTKGGRRLTRKPSDVGYSSEHILRFTGLDFKSAGTFKLCFCDSHLQRVLHGANGEFKCNQHSDFNIEIGKVHASGVSCLLDNTIMRRGECVAQYHGGLRCYQHAPVVPPVFIDDGVQQLATYQ
jgi:hypothetical protein